ncbi:MAG: serine--tRNA ligase [Deltaproteobacteria bacterium RIFOXYA12_FULL_61_11]|nr:MAG: serine--tRNA ligase [Deltaproteobacteria bacterium RIFOXYA12_FULL_61_11]
MLDIKFIRDNLDRVRKAAKDKRSAVDLDRLLSCDDERRHLLVAVETRRAEKKRLSKEIPRLQGDEKRRLLEQLQASSEAEKADEERLTQIVAEFDHLMLLVPNVLDEDVPFGHDDQDNVEVSRWGLPPSFSFQPRDHVELGQLLDILDIERGVKLSGSRFYFLKNEGVLLEMALLRLALDLLMRKGFIPFIPPYLVKREAMEGTGYFPGGEEQAYAIEKDGLYLIGTSEVPLAAYHYDEILDEKDLPRLYAGVSPCFRREAGTYGKDTRGIYRIHQFQKVEQVVLCANDVAESERLHRFLLANAEELLQSLGMPYRVVNVCTGDLGQGQLKKFDIETYMPSRGGYGETHSCSKFHEFQARRCKIRYRDGNGGTRFVHTLNNTIIASPRILIPLLELNQREDGSVSVPEILRPYLDGRSVLEPRRK